jgi:hypothetical protein
MTTSPKAFCFVLMPFDGKFNDIYQLGIKEACKLAGAYCERVDEQIFRESMLDRIYNQIAKADIIVADMTGRNPNVFYETGYAHALGKNVILLTQEADDIPFDLKHYPHVVYGGQIVQLQSELRRHIQWHLDNPDASAADSRLSLQLFANNLRLIRQAEAVATQRIAATVGMGSTFQLKLDVHNSAEHNFRTIDYAIGMITSLNVNSIYHGGGRDRTKWEKYELPDSSRYHRADFQYHIMAGDWESYDIKMRARHGYKFDEGEDEEIVVRLFADERFYDYPARVSFSRSLADVDDDNDD